MAIDDNIKRFKLNRDWTQGHLTDLVGVTRPTATQWEAGWSQPQMGATEKLAAFDVSVADMVDNRKHKSPIRAPSSPRNLNLLTRHFSAESTQTALGAQKWLTIHDGTIRKHHRSAPAHLFPGSEEGLHGQGVSRGCLILVDPDHDHDPQNGSIAAASIGGANYVIRHLLRTYNTMILAPESFNPSREDIVITAASEKNVELLDTAVQYQPAREME